MDNTLSESCRQISDEMAGVISNLVNNGFEFVVIAGSDVKEIKQQVCSKVNAKIHVLGTSGTKYYLWNGKELEKVYALNLTEAEKQKILDSLDDLCEKFDIKPVTSKEDQILKRGSQITLSAIGRHAPFEMKEAFDPDKKKRMKWINYLKPKLSEFLIVMGGSTSIDITKKGFDKGYGIKEFARYNHFNLDDILFFGDGIFPGGNDYSVVGVVDYVKVKNPGDTLSKLKELMN